MHAADGSETFFPGRYEIDMVLTNDRTVTSEITCTEKACTLSEELVVVQKKRKQFLEFKTIPKS